MNLDMMTRECAAGGCREGQRERRYESEVGPLATRFCFRCAGSSLSPFPRHTRAWSHHHATTLLQDKSDTKEGIPALPFSSFTYQPAFTESVALTAASFVSAVRFNQATLLTAAVSRAAAVLLRADLICWGGEKGGLE